MHLNSVKKNDAENIKMSFVFMYVKLKLNFSFFKFVKVRIILRAKNCLFCLKVSCLKILFNKLDCFGFSYLLPKLNIVD